MYCRHCGTKLPDDSKYCPGCGAPQADYPDQTIQRAEVVLRDVNDLLDQSEYQTSPYDSQYGYTIPGAGRAPVHRSGGARRCPRCGGVMNIQTVTEARSTGCGTVLLYVILALTIFGLLIVIPLMLRRKTDTYTLAICQSCGYRQRV